MNFETFQTNVLAWATERNFFGEGGATISGQIKKGISETGELADNMAKGRDIKDDLGDICVVAVIVAKLANVGLVPCSGKGWEDLPTDILLADITARWADLLGYGEQADSGALLYDIIDITTGLATASKLNIEDCYAQAWNDIKDRKGSWANGVFIKETDKGN